MCHRCVSEYNERVSKERIKMSDKPDDLTYWNGQPINAMTREALQEALIDANRIMDMQKKTISKLEKEIIDLESQVE